MNELLSKASSHLTGNENISDINLEEIERLAQDHPYFSVGQALLAKKYKTEDHSNFLSQVQKAAVFFNNPHWIHYQLLDARPEVVLSEHVQQIEKAIPVAVTAGETYEPVEEFKPENATSNTIYTKDEILAASSLAKETLSTIEKDETPAEEVEITPDELHPEKEEILEEIQEEEISAPEETETTREVEEEKEVVPVEIEAEEVSNEEIKPIEDPLSEKDLVTTTVEDNLVQPVSIEETLERTEPLPTEVKDDSPTAVSSYQIPEPAVPTPAAGEPLIPIEPYYTVDYFASQGIKLVLDKNPQDKLGKQLRSFTDWLKHMKKLGPEDALKTPQESEVDTAVKDSADTSNTPKEILTEAMAEVLIKQGKKAQAIEVYNKLSFLNPDKSPYFADQIQKLKGT